jgi:hypothetical protein
MDSCKKLQKARKKKRPSKKGPRKRMEWNVYTRTQGSGMKGRATKEEKEGMTGSGGGDTSGAHARNTFRSFLTLRRGRESILA